jgi:hypothetical protein
LSFLAIGDCHPDWSSIAAGIPGLVLEPLIPRLELSQFHAVFPWWILGHAWKVFNEINVRRREL